MNIFQLVANDTVCQSLLGVSPTRFTPFGATEHSVKPYAVYQEVAGAPDNPISCRPEIDYITIQVDVYADTHKEAKAIGEAIRRAIELVCYITSIRGISREPDTKLWRYSFDTEWITPR